MSKHYEPLYLPPKNSFGSHPKKGGPDVRPLPLEVTSFAEMIKGNYLYIDKTRWIHHMIREGPVCFLCRPRRFGKTLLLDTLKHIFRGEKDLFENLWISRLKYDWKVYPIIHFDFKIEEPERLTTKNFREFLLAQVRRSGWENGLKAKGSNSARAFELLIEALRAKYRRDVVILIDNYDSPLTSQFPDKYQLKKNMRVMNEFLSKLAAHRFSLRFVLMTGQFRFPDRMLYRVTPKAYDFSFNKYYAPLCGITITELDRHCYEHMEAATNDLKEAGLFPESKTVMDFRRAILYNYNGFSFDGETRLINPYTLMHTLLYKSFDIQAYNLELPDEQVKLIRDNNLTFDLFNSHHFVTRKENTVLPEIRPHPVLPYLLQTGYLTIRRLRAMVGSTQLMLRITNHEIREQLFMRLLAHGRNEKMLEIFPTRMAVVYRALKSLSVPAIETAFRLLLASINKPMNISEQDYFNNDLYLAMRTLFQPMEIDDPRTDGVLEGAIDFPGGNIFIIQIRSADREWITIEHDPFPDGDITKIAWPWRLPDIQRVLDPVEKKDPFWAELNTFMDLQAYKALEELDEKKYSDRFFPYVTPSTRVFNIGVAIYQREKVRVLIQETRKRPKTLPPRKSLPSPNIAPQKGDQA